MSSIPPAEHAAAIVAHYLRALTERAGLRWTPQNDADMQALAQLLDAVEAEVEQDSIPPFERPIVSDRQTVILDRNGNDGIPDPSFQKWRGQQRYTEDDDAAVRRLVRR
jgi:hypothetical protein